jgi:hypothetical protein
MFEVEIKVKRIDENGTYYEIVPIGELNDKLSYCETLIDKTDLEALEIGKTILNNITL